MCLQSISSIRKKTFMRWCKSDILYLHGTCTFVQMFLQLFALKCCVPPPATYCFHLKRTKHVHGKAVLVLHKGLLSESYDCHDAVVSVRKNGPFVVRPFPCHLFWGSTAVKCEESAAVQSLLFHNFYILFFWGEELSSLAVVYSLTLPSLQWKTHESFMKLMLFATQTIVTLFVSALKKGVNWRQGDDTSAAGM